MQRNYKVCCLLSNQKQCILLKDGHQRLLTEGSFYSKCKYHHAFCWIGDQSVSDSIQRFPSFHHQYCNEDMSLTSRLYQICVHSHKFLRKTTLQNYVRNYNLEQRVKSCTKFMYKATILIPQCS